MNTAVTKSKSPFFLNLQTKAATIGGFVMVSAAVFCTHVANAQTTTTTSTLAPDQETIIIDSSTDTNTDPLTTPPTPPAEEAPISLFPSEGSELFDDEETNTGASATNPIVKTVPADAILTEEEFGCG